MAEILQAQALVDTSGLDKLVESTRRVKAALNDLDKNTKITGPTAFISAFKDFNNIIKNIQVATVEMGKASQATKIFSGELSKAQQSALKADWGKANVEKMSQSLTKLGKDTQWTGRQLTMGLSLPILGGAQKAIGQFLDFDKQITKVKMNMVGLQSYGNGAFGVNTGPSVAQVDNLTKSITQTSHAYATNRTLLAGVAADLSAMGVKQNAISVYSLKAKDELSGLVEMSAKFAMIAGIGPDQAKDALVNLQNIYVNGDPTVKTANDRIEKTNVLMNELTAIATKVRAPIGDLLNSWPMIADASKEFNLSFSQTIALLASGSKQGLDTSMTATALGQAFTRITNPTKLAQDGLSKFAISAKDSAGNIKPGLFVLGQLGNLLKTATPAETAKLFGDMFNPRQAKSMIAVLEDVSNGLQGNKNNASDLMNALHAVGQDTPQAILAGAKAESQLSNQTKTALQAIADEKVKIAQAAPNFKWQQMTIDIKTAFATLGQNIAPVIGPILVGAVQKIQNLINWFDKLPDSAKKTIVLAGAFIAMMGPLLVLGGTLITSTATITSFVNKIVMMGKGIKTITQSQIDLQGGIDKVSFKYAEQGKILVPVEGGFKALKGTEEQLIAVREKSIASIREETAALAEQNAVTSASASGVEAQVARDAEQIGLIKKPKPLNLTKELGTAYKTETAHLAKPGPFNYAQKLGAAYQSENATSRVHRDMIKQEVDQAAREHITAQSRHASELSPDEKASIFRRVKARVDASRDAERTALPVGKSISHLYAEDTGPGSGHILPHMSRKAAGSLTRGVNFEPGSAAAPFVKLGSAAKATGSAVKEGFSHPIQTIGKLGSAILHPIANVKKLGGAFKSLVSGGPLAELAPALAPLAEFIVPIVLIGGAILLIVKNWKHVQAGIGDGIKVLKAAFGGFISAIITPFKKMWDGITGGADKSGKAAETMKAVWKSVGTLLNGIFHGLAGAFDIISKVAKPVLTFIANDIGFIIKIIQAIVLLMTGKWGAAWDAIKGAGAFAIKTILQGLLLIPQVILGIISKLVGWASHLPLIGSHFKGMARDVKNWSKDLDDLPAKIGDTLDSSQKLADKQPDVVVKFNKKKSKDAGREAGQAAGDGVNEGLHDALDKGPSGGGGVDPSEFLSALKSRVDKALDEMVASALKAYDKMADAKKKAFDLETKTQDENLDAQKKAQDEAIDAQIKGIDDLQKARDEALKEEEYRTKRLEMLQKMQEEEANYLRDRTLALYEGRVDDARNLDLEHIKNTRDGNKELTDLDKTHANDALKEQEDKNKELLSNQKQALDDQYEAQKQAYNDQRQLQKDALDQELADKRDNLELQLKALQEYTPRTVAELQNRINQMHGLLAAEGVDWGNQGTNARDLWEKATKDANKDLEDKAYWSNKGKEDAQADIGGMNDATDQLMSSDDWAASHGGGGNDNPLVANGGHLTSGGSDNPLVGYGGSWTVTVTPKGASTGGGSARNHHTGGFIGGPGAHPEDVPSTLQSGEYVIQRSAVSRFGTSFMDALNAGVIPKFHGGGLVGAIQNAGRNVMARWADNFNPQYMTLKWIAAKAKQAAMAASMAAGTQGLPGEAYTGPGAGVMSMQDVVNLARSVGFQGKSANMAAAIATAESGRNPQSYNPVPPDNSYGLWQINMIGGLGPARAKMFGLKAYSDLFDPKVNALAALSISGGGGNWGAWSTFTNGAYKRYLAEAMLFDNGGLLANGRIAMNTSGSPEFVLTKDMLRNLSRGIVPLGKMANSLTAVAAESVQTALGANRGDNRSVTIYVDNFIGQKEWFEKMMADHNVKVQPRIDRTRGTEKRVVG